jgi:hypothetical protein
MPVPVACSAPNRLRPRLLLLAYQAAASQQPERWPDTPACLTGAGVRTACSTAPSVDDPRVCRLTIGSRSCVGERGHRHLVRLAELGRRVARRNEQHGLLDRRERSARRSKSSEPQASSAGVLLLRPGRARPARVRPPSLLQIARSDPGDVQAVSAMPSRVRRRAPRAGCSRWRWRARLPLRRWEGFLQARPVFSYDRPVREREGTR